MVTNGKKQKLDTQFDNQDSLKPLQLQRRRVWRACESCRLARFPVVRLAHAHIHAQAQEDQMRWPRTHLQPVLDVQDPVRLGADQG